MAFPEQWEVNSGKWVASVFALFCSSNPVAVDYHSAGGQWGLFGIDLGFGAVLGIDLGLGLVLEIDSKKVLPTFHNQWPALHFPLPTARGSHPLLNLSHFSVGCVPYFCCPLNEVLNSER